MYNWDIIGEIHQSIIIEAPPAFNPSPEFFSPTVVNFPNYVQNSSTSNPIYLLECMSLTDITIAVQSTCSVSLAGECSRATT